MWKYSIYRFSRCFDWFRFACSLSHSLPYPMYFLLFYDKRRLTFQSFLYLLCSLVFHSIRIELTELNWEEHSIEYLKLIKLNRDVTIKIFESCLMNCLKCIFYYFGNSFIVARFFFTLLDMACEEYIGLAVFTVACDDLVFVRGQNDWLGTIKCLLANIYRFAV